MNRHRIARELVKIAREVESRAVITTDEALLNLRNLQEGRLDADSYEAKETVNFLRYKAMRFRDAGKSLQDDMKKLDDFVMSGGTANVKSIGYIAATLRILKREGLL